MGVLKVYNIDKSAVRNAGGAVLHPLLPAIYRWAHASSADGSASPAGFLEELREMLTRESDAQVVSNCMSVLQQVGLKMLLANSAIEQHMITMT